MAQSFNVVLGCDISTTGHIDEFAGVFSSLEENFRTFKDKNIIPARDYTGCPKRRTSQCNINCKRSVYGIRAGGKISWREKGKRM